MNLIRRASYPPLTRVQIGTRGFDLDGALARPTAALSARCGLPAPALMPVCRLSARRGDGEVLDGGVAIGRQVGGARKLLRCNEVAALQ